MRAFSTRASIVLVAALAAPMAIACSAEESDVGAVNLSLTGTSASGAKYRLRTATFVVTGPTNVHISSETDPDAENVRRELKAGSYAIGLEAGWSMERATNGGYMPVRAVLVSGNPYSFNIIDQGVTPVIFRFRAGDDVVDFGNGTLDLSIDVEDTGCLPEETECSGVCVDVQNDPHNCGACGNECPGSGGNPGVCTNGTCASPVFEFSGIRQNLPVAQLNGWTQCYSDTYANDGTPLPTILAQCSGARLLLGCRPVGSDTLTVAANAPRADVTFDTGTGNITHDANGVGWYYNNNWSWGFARAGDVLERNSCDMATGNPEDRLCWHTSGDAIRTGWRCGANIWLNSDPAWERVIYQTN